ncbi:sodium-dependent serotonin transporter-like [Panonychus citri]|uniref:sodium-dependent serotonin transporter-like n=1 Tax=Panonychus citri TaxID=50023 RepID=UPI002307EA80|nr:sodium-dependent serotonin transporter-like [Panonychus citri]
MSTSSSSKFIGSTDNPNPDSPLTVNPSKTKSTITTTTITSTTIPGPSKAYVDLKLELIDGKISTTVIKPNQQSHHNLSSISSPQLSGSTTKSIVNQSKTKSVYHHNNKHDENNEHDDNNDDDDDDDDNNLPNATDCLLSEESGGCGGGGGGGTAKFDLTRSTSSKSSLFTAFREIDKSIVASHHHHDYQSTTSITSNTNTIGNLKTSRPLVDPERETWDKKTEFLLAVIGFAVDLGNVWRFPFICYRNGGGAFLIPYLVMLIFGGLPLFYLELALGQYYRSGCLTLWKNICPIMKGIGYGICFIDLYLASYYNTIIAWAVYYLFASFNSELPWTSCNNTWNTPNCRTLKERGSINSSQSVISPAEEFFNRQVLQIHESTGIDNIGPVKVSLALCLALVFILVYFSLWKGVKSSGKAVWITATMPYVVLTVLLIRGITLEGSGEGIKYYLYPQWDKLLELQVWIDAATQIFFSLGPGFGVLLALSSYNKFDNNCLRDALFTSAVNCLTSFMAGFVIFSVLGYMANVMNKDVSNVVAHGPGLVFIVYPEAIATMQYSPFWAVLFFIMLITLGLDSTFGGLEALITGICDEYPQTIRKNREIFVVILITFIFLIALPTTTYGGNYVVQLLDTYGATFPLLFIVFIESVAICWFYGANRFSLQIKEMLGYMPGIFWRTCWTYISPIFLAVTLSFAIIGYKDLEWGNYKYPAWSIRLGWLITGSSVSCVPIYGIYHLYKLEGTLMQRLTKSIKPETTCNQSVGTTKSTKGPEV